MPLKKPLISVEWQLTESCRDGRHTELVFCHSLHSLARGVAGFIERKPQEPYTGKLVMFCLVLHWQLCYTTTLYANILNSSDLSTVVAESAYLCLGWPPLGVWTHMGWLSFARWGMWPPVWRQRVKVRAGGKVWGGGVQCLHRCTGFCYQYACSWRKRPWVVAWRWERGARAEGAAVKCSLLCLLQRWSDLHAPLPVLYPLSLQLTSLLLFLFLLGDLCSFCHPGVAWEGCGWPWRDEGCCPLVVPWSLCLRHPSLTPARQHRLLLQGAEGTF